MKRKFLAAGLCSVLLMTALTGCDSADYKAARSLMDGGDYAAAYEAFIKLGTYEDAAALAGKCAYLNADKLEKDGDIAGAQAAFTALGDYEDAAARAGSLAAEAKYLRAEELLAGDGLADRSDAIALLEELGDYKDSPELLKKACYQTAEFMNVSLMAGAYAGTITDGASFEAVASLYERAGDIDASIPGKLAQLRVLRLVAYVRANGERISDGYSLTLKKEETGDPKTAEEGKLTAEAYSLILRDSGHLDFFYYADENSWFPSNGKTVVSEMVYGYDILHAPLTGESLVRANLYAPGILSMLYSASVDIANAKNPEDYTDSKYESTILLSGKKDEDDRILTNFPYGKMVNAFDALLKELPFEVSMPDIGFCEVPETLEDTAVPAVNEAAETPEPAEEAILAEETAEPAPEPAASLEKEPTDAERFYRTQLSYPVKDISLYETPSLESAETAVVPYAAKLKVTASRDSWLYCATMDGQEGWTKADFVFGKWMFSYDVSDALRKVEKPAEYRPEFRKIVTKDGANVRSGPDGKKELLAVYPAGTECVWVATSGSWRLCWCQDAYGWIYSSNF